MIELLRLKSIEKCLTEQCQGLYKPSFQFAQRSGFGIMWTQRDHNQKQKQENVRAPVINISGLPRDGPAYP